MHQLVCFIFDIIGWASARLLEMSAFLSRGDQDHAAALVVALTSVAIVRIFRKGPSAFTAGPPRSGRRIIGRCALILLLLCALLHLGTQRRVLSPDKIQTTTEGVKRITLPETFVEGLKDSSWLLMSYGSAVSPSRLLLADTALRKVRFVSDITASGGGAYCLKGRSLYFSTPDGSDPASSGARTFAVVKDRAWFYWIRTSFIIGLLAWSLAKLAHLIGPPVSRGLKSICRDRAALLLLACFAVFFGSHQLRFVGQDARMQRVTSRFDDAYMLERLHEAARLKTLDSMALDNKAYGSIGFHPFAVFPFLCGHLGITPTNEALNIATRGLKLLISLAALASVWFLGTRHLGRCAAVIAVALLATNFGFLAYSSYPFYPDVMMAALATCSLAFMLDLSARWNLRSFLIAVGLAAGSVSVKFTTVPLFGFIGVIGIIALWRHHRGEVCAFFKALGGISVKAGALCVAVFFFYNPYLRYNTDWIVPNYKLAGSYYSAATPNFVAGAGATLKTWRDTCYAALPDVTDTVVVIVGIIVALSLAIAFATAKQKPRGAVATFVLLMFAALFQLYLAWSISLAEGIDSRLALPLYPALHLGAAWGVTRLAEIARRPREGSRLAWPALAILTALALVFAWSLTFRLANALQFHRHFGRPPAGSAVADWLTAADVPREGTIVSGMRSYVPAVWNELSDGMWQPRAVHHVLFKNSALPAVYIEDSAAHDENFSPEIASRGFQSDEQRELHEEGRALFDRLRTGRATPFVPVFRGEEIVATNAICPVSRPFRLYANPLAFTPDLVDTATFSLATTDGAHATDENGGVTMSWPCPITVGTLQISTNRKPSPPVTAQIELADGTKITQTVQGLGGDESAAQRLAKLEPARDIRSLTLLREDGALYPAALITHVHVHPPMPVGLNATRASFSIEAAGSPPPGLASLIDWRPTEAGGVKLEPVRELPFVLKATAKAAVDHITVVLEGAGDAVGAVCRCTLVRTDDRREELTSKASSCATPPGTYFEFEVKNGAAVRQVEFSIGDARGRRLSQVCVESHPLD